MFLFSKLPKQPKDGPSRSSARSCLLLGLLIWGIGLAKGEEPKWILRACALLLNVE